MTTRARPSSGQRIAAAEGEGRETQGLLLKRHGVPTVEKCRRVEPLRISNVHYQRNFNRYRGGVGSKGHYDGPTLTEPALGRSLTADAAYRTRSSAERQATFWNDVLEQDPVLGPKSGFQVGVAPLTSLHDDGPRWELIWVPCAVT